MWRDIKSHNLPPIVGQDDHYIQQPERCRSHDKHVDRGDTLGLIEQAATSSRGRSPASSDHVLGDRGLAYLDTELEEFPVNPRCAPERVGGIHLPNQIPNFVTH